MTSTSTRSPLGDSHVPNKLTSNDKNRTTYDRDDGKLKRALADALEQRQRRAEAEGNAQGWKRDLDSTKDQVQKLQSDLDKAMAKIARRDETIRSLTLKKESVPDQNLVNRSTGTEDLEKKLQDLVERHHRSKTKYQGEISTMKREKEALSKINAELVTAQESDRRMITELRQEVEANSTLRAEVDIFRKAQGSSIHKATREADRAQKLELEREVKRLRVLTAKIPQLEEERDSLEDLLETSTVSYALLRYGTVSKAEHIKLKEQYTLVKMERGHWKNRALRLMNRLKGKEAESLDLRDRFKVSEDERAMLEGMLRDVTADRELMKRDITFLTRKSERDCAEQVFLSNEDLRPLVDLSMTHSQIAINCLRTEIGSLSSERKDLLVSLTKMRTNLEETSTTLNTLRHSHAELQAVHNALQKDHSSCASAIEDLRTDLSRSEEREADTARTLETVSKELDEAERRSREDREALKRANEGVMRAKAAEDALDDEVNELRQALQAAEPFESLYNDLLDQQAILESRENAAIEEAELIAEQNAKLQGMGYNQYDGDMRIGYIEGVRREMARVKQELATTRRLLNNANDQITRLTNEIESYKSIDNLGSGMSASTRTRVVRRQPEGGYVIGSSTNTNAKTLDGKGKVKGRSVSGPVGR